MTTWFCLSAFNLCFITIPLAGNIELSCDFKNNYTLNQPTNKKVMPLKKEEAEKVLKAFQKHKQYVCTLIK